MTTITESDLKRLEDLIVNGQKEIETRLTTIETRLTNLETGQEDIKAKIDGMDRRLGTIEIVQAKIDGKIEVMQPIVSKFPDYSEKVGELKNWKQIAIVFFTAVVSAGIGFLIRSARFNP